jgi:hypothetical protein
MEEPKKETNKEVSQRNEERQEQLITERKDR